tara:strand:+ start:83 stop:253 length:171 start_codon:yes stop_codon:yes gene_type:complete
MANCINGINYDSIYDSAKNALSPNKIRHKTIYGIYVILADTLEYFSTSLPIPIEVG